ncbi:hypothetical protein EBB07_28705 [Paenibacillaceae bacterium]|nr:hypothetical protein EBB07_28705 [Paenibacillaceae bacterium]
MSLRSEVRELHYSISADIEHGECFYSEKYFAEFIEKIDQLKETSEKLFEENKAEDDEDEDY